MRKTNTAADRYDAPGIDRWTAIGLALLPFLVFLLSRPYIGIMHDARLYIGFALAQLDPNGIGQDLLFVADGQSGFSIYPRLLRELVSAIGPSHAAMLSAFAGLCAWFIAFHAFAQRWLGELPSVPFAAALLVTLSVSHYYGGTGVFRFAEPYATPRVFAEALVLLSLALLMAGRPFVMIGGLLAVAAAIHPIMTAPAIGIVLWWAARGTWVRVAMVVTCLVACLFVLFGGSLVGSDRIPFARFDAEWRSTLDDKASLVFMRWWFPQDYTRTLLQCVTVALAATVMDARRRRLLGAVLVVAASGLLVSACGADLVGNVLITQVQLWRSMWIVALLAALSLPILVTNAWGQNAPDMPPNGRALRRAATLLLLLAWIVVEYSVNAGPLALLAAVLWYLPTRWPHVALPTIGVPLIATLVIGLSLFMVGTQAWVTLELALSAPDEQLRTTWNYLWMTAVPGMIVTGVGVTGLVRASGRLPLRYLGPMLAGLVALVVFKWDSRTAYQMYLERALDERVAGGASTSLTEKATAAMWPFSDIEAWAFLGRPSWGSPLQGIPAVFSRKLAITWTDRWRHLQAVGLTPEAEGAQNLVVGAERWERKVSVQQLCAMPDAPAVLVLPASMAPTIADTTLELRSPKLLQPSTQGGEWHAIQDWKILHCAELRSRR